MVTGVIGNKTFEYLTVLYNPSEFFKRVGKEASGNLDLIGNAEIPVRLMFKILLPLALILLVGSYAIGYQESISKSLQLGLTQSSGTLLLVLFFPLAIISLLAIGIILMFLIIAFYHLIALILGCKKGFRMTSLVICYSITPFIISLSVLALLSYSKLSTRPITFLFLLLGLTYMVILMTVGFSVMHKVSKLKAFFLAAIPIFLYLLINFTAAAIIVFS